jgi:hypothetical protein
MRPRFQANGALAHNHCPFLFRLTTPRTTLTLSNFLILLSVLRRAQSVADHTAGTCLLE